MQTRKSEEDVDSIYDLCTSLTTAQVLKVRMFLLKPCVRMSAISYMNKFVRFPIVDSQVIHAGRLRESHSADIHRKTGKETERTKHTGECDFQFVFLSSPFQLTILCAERQRWLHDGRGTCATVPCRLQIRRHQAGRDRIAGSSQPGRYVAYNLNINTANRTVRTFGANVPSIYIFLFMRLSVHPHYHAYVSMDSEFAKSFGQHNRNAFIHIYYGYSYIYEYLQ